MIVKETQIVDDLVSLASDLSVPELRALALEVTKLVQAGEEVQRATAIAEMNAIAASVGLPLRELVTPTQSRKAHRQ
jgi:hypothetical protein